MTELELGEIERTEVRRRGDDLAHRHRFRDYMVTLTCGRKTLDHERSTVEARRGVVVFLRN